MSPFPRAISSFVTKMIVSPAAGSLFVRCVNVRTYELAKTILFLTSRRELVNSISRLSNTDEAAAAAEEEEPKHSTQNFTPKFIFEQIPLDYTIEW